MEFYTYFGIVAFWYLFVYKLLPWIDKGAAR